MGSSSSSSSLGACPLTDVRDRFWITCFCNSAATKNSAVVIVANHIVRFSSQDILLRTGPLLFFLQMFQFHLIIVYNTDTTTTNTSKRIKNKKLSRMKISMYRRRIIGYFLAQTNAFPDETRVSKRKIDYRCSSGERRF